NATTNPCAKSRDYNKHATVKQIAQYYKRIAHKQLNERAGRSALKGDATKGKYMSSLSEKRLYEICKITKDNSNAKREFSKHPCAGKDREKKLFELKDVWKTGTDVQMSHKDVFMPPRREHFCTSNLEFLDTDYIPFIYYGAKVINDSFLGDVLLSAKSEADKIIDMYPKNNGQNDKEGICRAIRYSFADIGDIIKGTDLWEANPGEKNTQRRLETVFGKIKKQFNGKYTHEEAKPPYRQLRADWWEANRHQVWKAMKCAIKEFNDTSVSTQSNGYCGYSDHTPLDDYIPQRLRWMTEWAEWYCKMQKEAYDKLKQDCIGCTGKDRDCNKSGKCGKCTISCENYKKFINTWQTQWKEMEQKYESLYKEAQENDNSSHKSTTEQDKYVVEFLSQLQKANNGDKTGVDTVYSTAAGYVHQEAPYMECQGQKHFCDEKHEEYAFKNPPNGYDVVCKCKDRPEQQIKKKEVEDACKIVETLLSQKGENDTIGNCKGKYKNVRYPEWKCNSQIDPKYTGACMPPRRQKLCIHFLAHKSETPNLNTQEDLRKAFIKSAAAEIFFSWYKYKKDNNNVVDFQNQLKKGEIPDDFKRQMFYTFGDYRDLCLGNDLGNAHDTKNISVMVTSILNKEPNSQSVGQRDDKAKRETWWNGIKNDVWNGMLCSLEKVAGKTGALTNKDTYNYKTVTFTEDPSGPNLQTFATRPQFLRWFTEWGEEFCAERQKKEAKVKEYCKKEYEGCEKDKNVTACAKACEEYKKYITDKNSEYTNQEGKFKYDKSQKKQGYNDISNDDASEYLKDKCLDSQCNCMDKVKNISNYWETPHTTYDDNSLQKKCSCPPPPCEIVDGILGNISSKGYVEGCKTKYMTTSSGIGWECNNSVEKGNQGACIPPRRRKLYVYDLKTLSGEVTQVQLREAFIKCAAIETFFAWHKFKKIKEKEDKEQHTEELMYISPEPDKLNKDLKKGEVPEEFKRQLFYTFGDYRDILFGKDMSKGMGELNDKINKVFANGGGKIPSGRKITPKEWWEQNAKDIWEGMLCALSYNTETKEMDKDVRTQLIENSKNKYLEVTFIGGFNSDKTSTINNTTTKLTDFVKRPPYFRWLEEWADEF
ncbi:hypothetical protein PFMALIP_06005, partial [Plasmodium falciparum MaliPS096_E11]